MKKIILFLLICTFAVTLVAKNRGPKVGSWAKYKVKSNNDFVVYRIGITGKEDGGVWYETVLYGKEDGKSVKTVMSMLIKKNKNGEDVVQRFVMQHGKETAKELPANLFHGMGEQQKAYFDQLEKLENQNLASQDKNIVVKTKNGSVKTPAGTFKVKIISVLDKSNNKKSVTYLSKSVAPYGVVQYVEDGVTQSILLAYGKNGKSQITGKIQKIDLGKEMGNMLKGNFGGMFNRQ